jgi:alpha-D-xyloside xylohydrolase
VVARHGAVDSDAADAGVRPVGRRDLSGPGDLARGRHRAGDRARPADPITLYVYTGKDGAFTLYEDEGTNYNYEKGAYSNIPITYNEANRTLTIGKRTGTFSGMLNQRTFNIIWVTKTNPFSPDRPDSKPAATIRYQGEQVAVPCKG